MMQGFFMPYFVSTWVATPADEHNPAEFHVSSDGDLRKPLKSYDLRMRKG
jgi:hypothetical protein